MFIEGHWKALKRDFLYKFFRPQLDLVTYIILLKIIPLQERKFQQILAGCENPDWKKQFKAKWKRLSKHIVSAENTYATNIQKWVCGCPYFLTNQYDLQIFNSIKRGSRCEIFSHNSPKP